MLKDVHLAGTFITSLMELLTACLIQSLVTPHRKLSCAGWTRGLQAGGLYVWDWGGEVAENSLCGFPVISQSTQPNICGEQKTRSLQV